MNENNEITKSDTSCRITSVLKIVESSFLPEFPEALDRPLDINDFADFTEKCERNLLELSDIFKNCHLVAEIFKGHSKANINLIASVVVLCGQHSQAHLWSSDTTVKESQNILGYLTDLCQVKDLVTLLTDNKEEIFKQVLVVLRPWLLADSWKNYPAAVICYSWVLNQIKIPHLSDSLSSVLPTALLISDDFVIPNIIIGVQSIEHIINNITRTELQWYGQDKVIYKALWPSLYKKEAELIQPLFSALITLLEKMCPQNLYSNLEWTEYDDVLKILLNNMCLEQRLDIRESYLKIFPPFIVSMGVSVNRHSGKIFNILEDYIVEPTTSLLALKAVDSLLSIAWPRKESWCRPLLSCLLKLLRDSTDKNSCHPEEMISALSNTLTIIGILHPKGITELRENKDKLKFNPRFEMVLSSALK